MTAVGANVDDLRRLAATFRQKADVLEGDVIPAVTYALSSSPWQGRDADGFRGAWGSALAPRVHASAASLRAQADRLERNANQQDQASAVSGGSVGASNVARSEDRSVKASDSGAIRGWSKVLGKSGNLIENFGANVADGVVRGLALGMPGVAASTFLGRIKQIRDGFRPERFVKDFIQGADRAGHAGQIQKIARGFNKVGKYAGRVSTALTFASDGLSKYQELRSNANMSEGERILHASVYSGVKTVSAWAGAKGGAAGGAALGFVIGGPVGAVVGGVIGAVGGNLAGGALGDIAGQFVTQSAAPALKAIGGAATNIVKAAAPVVSVLERVSPVVSGAAHVIRGGAKIAGKVGNFLGGFFR